jgi:hypothetical protein
MTLSPPLHQSRRICWVPIGAIALYFTYPAHYPRAIAPGPSLGAGVIDHGVGEWVCDRGLSDRDYSSLGS